MEEAKKICKDIQCTKAGVPQLLSAFPINRRIPDGHHRYCRVCCVRRVHKARADRREREAEKKKLQPAPLPIWFPEAKRKLRERDARVLEVIRKGARTQRQIKSNAGLESIDEVGLSLAELIINRGLVRATYDAQGERIYIPVARMAQVA